MATYVNRTYDSVASALVRWSTAAPDTVGALYPGPGVFGVTATDYCVESILSASIALADFRNDFITGQTVTGTDSVLSTSLVAAPSDGESILIIYNRQAMSQGQDFTVSGTAITWLASSGTAPDLIPGDTLFVYYVVDSLTVTIDFINDFITGESVTGTDSVLSGALSSPPSDPESVICAYNRQVMSQGQDFAVSGTAVTWLASSGTAPDLVAGDTLQFYYVVNTTGSSLVDNDAIHDNVASEISVVAEKVLPIPGDWVLIESAADGNAKRRANVSSLLVASRWVATQTAPGPYLASAFQIVQVDPTGGAFSVQLPASPTTNDIVIYVNVTTDTTTITVDGNGNNVNGAATKAMSDSRQFATFSFNGTDWFQVG